MTFNALYCVLGFQSTLSMRRATVDYGNAAANVRFQSTLSMRRATNSTTEKKERLLISIHALHEESDLRTYNSCNFQYVFQSTLSMRRATR